MSKKPKTNVALITHLMEFSPQGAMMQAFVIEALGSYAQATLEQDPWPENSFVNQGAWKACAAEVAAAIDGRNK